MDKDELFDEFNAKLKDIVNFAFNLGEHILEPKIVRKILRSLPKRFYAKITVIGSLQTYKLGLARVGKGGKGKNMALKTKNDDNDESSDDEDTKLKSYITTQFKKFIKNANVNAGDKDSNRTAFSEYKSQDKGKREFKDAGQDNGVLAGPKCYRCHRFKRMTQECPTFLKSIGKSKALVATLSDSKPEADFDESDQEWIVSAFTATVDSTKGKVDVFDEEEELMESKFENMDDQDDIHTDYAKLYNVSEKHEKLYRLATRKLSEVELECKELSTKVDEANHTIGALRFENNLLVEKDKKLDAELFQVKAQFQRTSNVKLDEMLNV